MEDKSILELKEISKTFIATRALNKVSLSIDKGEIRGLAGENGSGKSTLVSIVAGIINSDSGKMFKDSYPYNPKNMIEATENKIGIIVQGVGTIDEITVAMSIFLGEEDKFLKFGFINNKDMNNSALELLLKYDISNINPQSFMHELTFEDRKLVELVKALYFKPDLLIVDETTSALSQFSREILYNVILELKKENKSVIFITHDLDEIIQKTDNITVMRDGEIVKTVKSKDSDINMLKRLMVGRKLTSKYYREDYDQKVSDTVVMSVKNINYKEELKNINIKIHKGEIVGVGGLTSCGMHALGKILFGIIKPSSGEIYLNEKNAYIRSVYDSLENNIGYIPKDRDLEGLMILSSIKENIALTSINDIQKHGFISPKDEEKLAQKGVKTLNIKTNSIEQLCIYLSGGNKQKVVLSKWMVKNPEIFIMDCPTRGIDVNVKASIYALIEQLKNDGKSIIIISEELLELIGMCDRIIIMKKGEISNTFKRTKSLSEEELIHYMI
jgi:ribose transport system ATP-binding protein